MLFSSRGLFLRISESIFVGKYHSIFFQFQIALEAEENPLGILFNFEPLNRMKNSSFWSL